MLRLADAMQRARYAVAAAWLIAAVLSLAAVSGAFGTKLNDLLSNRFDLPGTESERALTLLADHFGQRTDSGYTLVFSGDMPPGAQAAVLKRAARVVPGARIGPLQPAGPGVSFAQIDTRLEPQPAALRVEPMRRAIGPVARGRVYVSGQVAINHDLQPVFDADLRRGEEIAIPIAVLVLLVVFGTATATLVPLLMAAGTVPVTLGLLWILAHEMNMAIYVTNLVTLIGIAIAIDYSLLVVYRFREELLGGADERAALRTTMRTAGHAVLFSGVTVAIGLACLVLIPLPFIRSMGVGGLLIPLVSILAAMTLLPALLAAFGSSLLRLRVPLIGLRPDREGGVWGRIAEVIMRRPAIVAGLTGGFLVLCALPAPLLSLTPGSSKGLPSQASSVQGLELLERTLGPGTISPLIAVVDSGRPGASGGPSRPSAGSSRRCAPTRRSRSCRRRPSPARRRTCRPTARAAMAASWSPRGTTTGRIRRRSSRAASAAPMSRTRASAARACTRAAARPPASTSSIAPTASSPGWSWPCSRSPIWC